MLLAKNDLLLNQVENEFVLAQCRCCKDFKIFVQTKSYVIAKNEFEGLLKLLGLEHSDLTMELILNKDLLASSGFRKVLLASDEATIDQIKTLVMQTKLLLEAYQILGIDC